MCHSYYINSDGKYVDCFTGEVYNFMFPPKNSLVFKDYQQFLNSTASSTPDKVSHTHEKPKKKKSIFNLFKKEED